MEFTRIGPVRQYLPPTDDQPEIWSRVLIIETMIDGVTHGKRVTFSDHDLPEGLVVNAFAMLERSLAAELRERGVGS